MLTENRSIIKNSVLIVKEIILVIVTAIQMVHYMKPVSIPMMKQEIWWQVKSMIRIIK